MWPFNKAFPLFNVRLEYCKPEANQKTCKGWILIKELRQSCGKVVSEHAVDMLLMRESFLVPSTVCK